MLPLRAAKSFVLQKVLAWFGGTGEERDEKALRMAQMTSLIHLRELRGMTTTLRQLHQISDLDQPEALTLIAHLEAARIVTIERNLGDAFESTIALQETTRRRLDRAVHSKPARQTAL